MPAPVSAVTATSPSLPFWSRRSSPVAVQAIAAPATCSPRFSPCRWPAGRLAGWALLALLELLAAAGNGLRRAAVSAALLVVAVVAVQQLPLSAALWGSIPVGDSLAQDLLAAGVATPRHA